MSKLTILTLFSGKEELLEPFLDQLDRLRTETDARLLLIDNSGSLLFHDRLRALGGLLVKAGGKAGMAQQSGGVREELRTAALQTERLYRMAQEQLGSGDLLILEDDVFLPKKGLARLFEGRVRSDADLVSGWLLSRHTAEWLAWRLRGRAPEKGVRRVFPSRGLKRVFATGFGALLTRCEIFREFNIRAEIPGLPFWGCDLNAGLEASEKGLRWFVHGGVRCRHANRDGTFVLHGGRRNVRWDYLAGLAGGVT